MPLLDAFVQLSDAMALYTLLGLLFAGIAHQLIPANFIQSHLGHGGFRSILKATLLGIPLPICSCGVVPLAASLQKSGASKGSVLSFLISTPITGIDSILATYGMFGWFFTIYRVATATIIALVAGWCAEKNKERDPRFHPATTPITPLLTDSCHTHTRSFPKAPFRITEAIRYGFDTLLGDIAPALFWGLLIGALITAVTPSDLTHLLGSSPIISYLLAILLATPMYVCATASLPIAAALVLNGVNLGAAFVFLSAGPATNTVTIGVVKRMLGTRILLIYLITIILGSILFGSLLDLVYQDTAIEEIVQLHQENTLLYRAASVALWLLLGYHMFKKVLKRKSCSL